MIDDQPNPEADTAALPTAAAGAEQPPSAVASDEMARLTDEIITALKTVYDPEIPVNIVDLGLIYSCVVALRDEGGNKIHVKMSMTAPGCGMGDVLKADVQRKLSHLPDVKEVQVDVVFEPAWHMGLMSEAAKLQLGL